MNMQIQNNSSNNLSFNGIKLSNPKFESVRNVAMHLKKTEFLNLGHKTIYCNNVMTDKMAAAAKIRAKSGFFDKEFGCVFFPWSKEAYIMASPAYEKFMLPIIKQYDKGACINFLI